jgi:hypothetical protein
VARAWEVARLILAAKTVKVLRRERAAEAAAVRRDRLRRWAALALTPPAALLALGLAGTWVARGFRGAAR